MRYYCLVVLYKYTHMKRMDTHDIFIFYILLSAILYFLHLRIVLRRLASLQPFPFPFSSSNCYLPAVRKDVPTKLKFSVLAHN